MKVIMLDKYKTIYELIMMSLALIVSVLVIRELTLPLSEHEKLLYRIIDWTVLVIFASDYFVRLCYAQDKKIFLRKNIPELIAIIPFDSIFRLARLFRLVRLFRFIRAIVILRRFSETFFGVLRTNNLQYVVLITVGIILLGAIGIQHLERGIGHIQTFGDALWWSLVTTTTVGYGDISPKTAGGRVLAAFLMIVGIGFLGLLTGTIATYFIDQVSSKEEVSLDNELKVLIKSRIDNLQNFNTQEVEELVQFIKSYNSKNKEVDF